MSTVSQTFRKWVLSATAIVCSLAAIQPVAFAQPAHTVLHSFNGTDGFGPMAGVIQGNDGALYGTTSQGGSASLGTVFRLPLTSPGLTTLHSFSGVDGSVLYSGLTLSSDGLLYGSTYSGGASDLGTLFRVRQDGGSFSSLYSFGGTDGAKPDDLKLTQANDGSFYGATSEGGAGGGTLFRFDPATSDLSTVHSFPGTAGVDASLMASNGVWYGTTYSGGANGMGSVFVIDPFTDEFRTLHSFSGADGAYPVPGSLMQARDGNLYGTTQLGGNGTVYRLNLDTELLTTLHVFSGTTDGRMPLGGLTEAGDGYLYGTTVLGGQGYGTVFRVNPTTLDYGIVVRFGGSNGRSPSGNLCLAADNSLYGVTRLGGAFNAGTVYRVRLGDTTPPTITSITATPSVLKPASGKMVSVQLNVAARDAVDPAPKSRITGVTCNQSASGDWTITGDLTVKLRAKQVGRTQRIYTIKVECTDAAGNSTSGTVNVPVSK